MTFGSLFSGAGGFDMGFHEEGFKCLWTAETNRMASDVLAKQGAPNLGDVRAIDGEQIEVPDVVVWGSPCQDISLANRNRKGLDGDKSKLFYEGIRILEPLRRRGLRFSVWENSAAAVAASRPDDFRQVLLSFLQLGATELGWRVLDARFAGVPHNRRRVFVVADFGGRGCGEVLRYPGSSQAGSPEGSDDGVEVCPVATEGAGAACEPPDQIKNHWCIKAQRPQNETSPGYIVAHPCITTGAEKSTSRGSYLPHKTPDGIRLRFATLRERERLMGWPDDWTRFGASGKEMSDNARYTMTGNGVVRQVAKFLAEGVRMALGAA